MPLIQGQAALHKHLNILFYVSLRQRNLFSTSWLGFCTRLHCYYYTITRLILLDPLCQGDT